MQEAGTEPETWPETQTTILPDIIRLPPPTPGTPSRFAAHTATKGDIMENAFKTFGTNLRRIRLAKGMTQAELCNAAGISIDTASKLETLRTFPRQYTAQIIADALGVTLDEMMKPTEEKK